MKKQKLDYPLYLHKSSGRLFLTREFHEHIEADPETAEENYRAIDSAKELFRDFLKRILDGEYEVTTAVISYRQSSYEEFIEDMREAYRRSDFDWKNREEFLEFGDWYKKVD